MDPDHGLPQEKNLGGFYDLCGASPGTCGEASVPYGSAV